MRNELNIRLTYLVSNMVPNVDSEGLKTLRDPIFDKVYGYGSAANVKFNNKLLFADILNVMPLKKVFTKKLNCKNKKLIKSDEGEQCGVSTKINVENPNVIFGAWDNITSKINNKRRDAKLKASIRFSMFEPIHPLLSKTYGLSGVNHGQRGYDEVNAEYTGTNNVKTTLNDANEIQQATGCTIEDAEEWLNSQRLVNVYKSKYETNGMMSGVYKVDITIETDRLYRITKEELEDILTTDEIESLINEKGWRTIETLGTTYYMPPKEEIEKVYIALVDTILNWDFSSNNSLNGGIKQLLRVDVAFNNTNKWQYATYGTLLKDTEKPKAILTLHNDLDGVYSFTTPLLESVPYTCADTDKGVSVNALDEAKEKMLELGKTFIV